MVVSLSSLALLVPPAPQVPDGSGAPEFLIPAQQGLTNDRLYHTLADVERVVEEYDKLSPPHEEFSRWTRSASATGVVSRSGDSGIERLAPRQWSIRLSTQLDWPDHFASIGPDGRHLRNDSLELMVSQVDGEPPRYSVRIWIGGGPITHELGADQFRYEGQARDMYSSISRRLQRDELDHGFTQEVLHVSRDVPASLQAALDAHRPSDLAGRFDMQSSCGVDFRFRAVLIDETCELVVSSNGSRGPYAVVQCLAEAPRESIVFHVDEAQAKKAYDMMAAIAAELPRSRSRHGLSLIERQLR